MEVSSTKPMADRMAGELLDPSPTATNPALDHPQATGPKVCPKARGRVKPGLEYKI